MQLHTNGATPFGRKVSILIHEAGRTAEVETVHATGTAIDTSKMPLGINPLGKIPVLVRDDGPAVYDSRVICRYLDHLWGTKLYPDSRLWEVLTLEATADGIMDAALLMVTEARVRPEGMRHEPWVEAQWAKASRALDALEERWAGQLAGPLTIGQIAVGAALGYLDFRHGAREWRTGRPALAAWEKRFAERESMKATAPQG